MNKLALNSLYCLAPWASGSTMARTRTIIAENMTGARISTTVWILWRFCRSQFFHISSQNLWHLRPIVIFCQFSLLTLDVNRKKLIHQKLLFLLFHGNHKSVITFSLFLFFAIFHVATSSLVLIPTWTSCLHFYLGYKNRTNKYFHKQYLFQF